jgi:putative restriction endonuclease
MASNYEFSASKAWEILGSLAQRKKCITYGELGEAIGVHWRQVNHVLGLLQDYCIDNDFPPITILVVNKATGVPGTGFIATENLPEGKNEVQQYPWQYLENPFGFADNRTSFDSLLKRLLASPDKSEEIYSLVKVRGQIQSLFRNLLLEVYEGQCAVSGITFEESLEAAHIVPWRLCKKSDRLNSNNGILLSSFHHRLFDAGLISLDEKYKIIYFDSKMKELGEDTYSKIDKILTVDLHGRDIFLPKDVRFRPGLDFIRQHNAMHGFNN